MKKNAQEVTEVALIIANNPEVGGEEEKSSAAHVQFLEKHGMQVEKNYLSVPYAYYCPVVEKGDDYPTVFLLAEYDALPNIGHGCGHAASGAISLLSAAALHENRDKLNCNIALLGCPDEENTGHKITLISRGAFDHCDFAMMTHMESKKNYPNYEFMACASYRVIFRGKSAHAAASPWDGKNALDALTLTMAACGLLRQQLDRDSVVSYYVVRGGLASNVIPEETEIEFLLRHKTSQGLHELARRIELCARGSAMSTETDCTFKPHGYEFSDMIVLSTGTEIIRQSMVDSGIEPTDFDGEMVSSDVGAVSHACPAFQPALGVSDTEFSLHTARMAQAVKDPHIGDIISRGAEMTVRTIARLSADPALFVTIRKEFERAKE